MLIKCSFQNKKSLLAIEKLTLECINKAIQGKYNLQDFYTFTDDNVQIDSADLVEYIQQYSAERNFILFISKGKKHK